MKEMRETVGKKIPKKEMGKPSFSWRHMADFYTLYLVTKYVSFLEAR